MPILDDYTNLITSEHIDKPKFKATVEAFAENMIDIQNVALQLIDDFFIDDAIGVQLDALGLWIGQSRVIEYPIQDVYFSWDTKALEGWDTGVWKQDDVPDNVTVTLDDDDYRSLLKSKISANSWKGDIEGAYRNITAAFITPTPIKIVDNQDMSITVQIPIGELSVVQEQLIKNQYIITKSSGITAFYEFV